MTVDEFISFIITTDGFNEVRNEGVEWVDFGLVLRFFDDDGEFQGSSGYKFDKDGFPDPCALDPLEVEHQATALAKAMSPSPDDIMLRMLLQFNRETGRFKSVFEFDDPTRWQVDPGDFENSINAIRPVWD